MPRFYFHIHDGSGIEDDLGMELADIREAKCEAVRYAGRLICDQAGEFWNSADWNMTVSDDKGLSLFTLQFTGMDSPAIPRPVHSPRPSA